MFHLRACKCTVCLFSCTHKYVRTCSMCYTVRTHTSCVLCSFLQSTPQGLCIKQSYFDWPLLQIPHCDSSEDETEPSCICVEGSSTTTCLLSIPLCQLSGPYLALMRGGNTHRHMYHVYSNYARQHCPLLHPLVAPCYLLQRVFGIVF